MEFVQNFDIIVIGGGPAGYHVANILAKNGKAVALFEKKSLGGTCLNEGCIPSKTFLKSAKIVENINHSADFGVEAQLTSVNQRAVVERKNSVVNKLVMGVRGGLRKNKVKLFFSSANLMKKEDGLYAVESDGKIYGGEKLIIATGSKVFVPPIKGISNAIENKFVLTSSEIFDLQEIPNRLVIIGAGIIGLEMASYFSAMGSKVTVMETSDKICGSLDNECAFLLQKIYTNNAIEFLLNCKVVEVFDRGVKYINGENQEELFCDKILLATGRIANVDGFGIENLNVEYSKGGVAVNNFMQTTDDCVYAIGDVNGKVMLAHTAYKEAEVCADHILGRENKINYSLIPSILYSSPECAWVGVNEAVALADEKYSVKKLSMLYSGRFVAENAVTEGLCKLIIDNNKQTLAGAFLVGNGVSEVIFILSSFIELEIPIEKISNLIFPHPTIGELIKETLKS